MSQKGMSKMIITEQDIKEMVVSAVQQILEGTNYDTLYHAKVQEKIRPPNETNRSRIFNTVIYLPYF